ncbi:hypothetical protein V2J09_002133 [Rumex salicifolius]
MNSITIPTTRSFIYRHCILPRLFTTNVPEHKPTPPVAFAAAITPVDPAHLLRVCTVLYQQQHSTFPKLQSHLQKTEFRLTHEFFLQVCNKFPLSWRPVYLFHQFASTRSEFSHTPVSFNKLLNVVGKARNVELFWEILNDIARRRFVTRRTVSIAMTTLGGARELKKCVEFFQVLDSHGYPYSLETLNQAVNNLCREKLVDEAKHVVVKLKDRIGLDSCTYKHLICGFCDTGDVIEASKLWNSMVDEGFEADIVAVNKMIETFFKKNQMDEALKLFKTMKEPVLSTYNLVIHWLAKQGKLSQAHHLFDEMLKREIQPDDDTVASLIYGLASKMRIREAYLMLDKIKRPSINVYNALIKGLVRVKSTKEATEVFREMIKRGCEPTMHTYIMLLQAHLGRRGRKGRDPFVNFDTIFVGGLVKAGRSFEASKYVERVVKGGTEVPKFDYNRFLQCYSNEEGVVMFEEVGKKLREVGLFDLADVFARYGEKMATRDRRRNR